MTDIEPAEKLFPRIMKQYSDEPKGWNVLNTPQGDLIIIGPTSSFQLRLISLSPYDFTGVGCEIKKNIDSLHEIRSEPSFGLRPLTNSDLRVLFNAVRGDVNSQKTIREIIRRAPASIPELTSQNVDHILSGPILTRPDLCPLGPVISELSERLEVSARRLFEQRYPHRVGMYF